MPINIDALSEDELRDLHHRITARLRVMQQLRAHGAMLSFSIGDRVAFAADGRRIAGVLTRYNRKTVTVLTDGGHHWNVSPGLLEKLRETKGASVSVVVVPVTHEHPGRALPEAPGREPGGRQ